MIALVYSKQNLLQLLAPLRRDIIVEKIMWGKRSKRSHYYLTHQCLLLERC